MNEATGVALITVMNGDTVSYTMLENEQIKATAAPETIPISIPKPIRPKEYRILMINLFSVFSEKIS